ncbi:hypothetical protein E2C01_029524 [Portunus trituberculatus]|uniref:Uncharacterized protein n=1 Tax=Portunus trituberculatus TaxID=210409 RepID=A0A5B7ES60_PORTR|nr:hypothetical protein [Portunus trituberculatus]
MKICACVRIYYRSESLNLLNIETCFHIVFGHYLVILYSFRNSCR